MILADEGLMAVVSEMSGSLLQSLAMNGTVHRCAMLLLAILLLIGGSALATADDDDDRDHEFARQALAEGRIRPLTEILESFKAQFAGKIVGVELKAKAKKPIIYEFKVLTPDGKLKEVKVDAATAKIIKIEDED
jgi:uncharacterized membrane protein YkoI